MQDTITKIGPRRFIESRGFWSISIKVDGKWKTKWKKSEGEMIQLEKQLHEQCKANQKEVVLKPTVLSQTELSSAESAVKFLRNRLQGRFKEDMLFDAAKRFIETAAHIQTPTLYDAVCFFEDRCKAIALADTTIQQYKWTFDKLMSQINPEVLLSDLKKEQFVDFIKTFPLASRRAAIVKIKTFVNFCKGEKNPHIQFEDEKWLNWNIADWYLKPPSKKTVRVITYEEVLTLLRSCFYRRHITNAYASSTLYETNQITLTSTIDAIAYYMFRLHSMMRTSEAVRFFAGHRTVKDHPAITKDLSQIWVDSNVWRKRAASKSIGRKIRPKTPAFIKWLKWMWQSNAVLYTPKPQYAEIELSSIDSISLLERRNILRHSGITFHTHYYRDPILTAGMAGNSIKMIQDHYLDFDCDLADIKKIYALDPEKCFEEGVFPTKNFPFDFTEPDPTSKHRRDYPETYDEIAPQ